MDNRLLLSSILNYLNFESGFSDIAEVFVDDILSFLKRHKLISLLAEPIAQFLEPQKKNQVIAEKKMMLAEQHSMLEVLKELHGVFTVNTIPFILSKGFVLSKIIYNDFFKRDFIDLDIFVFSKEKMLEIVNILVKKYGFLICSFDDEYQDSILSLKDEIYIPFNALHHEITIYKKINEHTVYVELKYTTGAISHIDLQKKDEHTLFFIQELDSIEIEGLQYTRFNNKNILFHLILNAYFHSEQLCCEASIRLRDYIDIYVYLVNHDFKNRWTEILDFAKKINVVHMCKVIICRIADLFPDIIPPEVFSLFTKTYVLKNNYVFPGGENIKHECRFKEMLVKEQHVLQYDLVRYYLHKISDAKTAKNYIQTDQPGKKYKMFNDLTDNKFRFEYSINFVKEHIVFRLFNGNTFFQECESTQKIEVSFLREYPGDVATIKFNYYLSIVNVLTISKDNIYFQTINGVYPIKSSLYHNLIYILIPFKLNEGVSNYSWLGYEVAIYKQLCTDCFQKIGGQNIFFDMTVFPRIICNKL